MDPHDAAIAIAVEVVEQIAAQPNEVYDLVADLARMGEWSPENTGGEWLTGGPGQVGARFVGHNVVCDARWDGELVITAAERGRVLAWVMGGNPAAPRGTWRYRFEPFDGGTRVIESYTLGPASSGFRDGLAALSREDGLRIVADRAAALKAAMATTLARLKHAAELTD